MFTEQELEAIAFLVVQRMIKLEHPKTGVSITNRAEFDVLRSIMEKVDEV